MAKLALSDQTMKSKQLMAEAYRETERMRDVRLLLDHLLRQENITIKFILDCLYDVGSVNLINQKVRSQPLNRCMKAIAVMSKPAFRLFALRWLRKNCPELITNWLYRKVSFQTPATQPQETIAKVIEAQTSTLPALESDRQVRQLRYQVRWLTGILVGVVLLWGGSVILPNYSPGLGSTNAPKLLQQRP